MATECAPATSLPWGPPAPAIFRRFPAVDSRDRTPWGCFSGPSHERQHEGRFGRSRNHCHCPQPLLPAIAKNPLSANQSIGRGICAAQMGRNQKASARITTEPSWWSLGTSGPSWSPVSPTHASQAQQWVREDCFFFRIHLIQVVVLPKILPGCSEGAPGALSGPRNPHGREGGPPPPVAAHMYTRTTRALRARLGSSWVGFR